MNRIVVLLAAALLLAGCTPTVGWPTPDPDRPVVELAFDVADDLRSVQGHEHIDFTPDRRVCELVFRSWPNKPATARRGNALEVTAARVGGREVAPVVRAAGAPDGHPGTLVEVPLPRCVEPGRTVTADLSFELTLGPGTDERVGMSSDGDVAWFATAFPLLAWERGRGWATDPAVGVVGEMTTSETFDLRSLEVVAPSRYEVMGTGAHTGSRPGERDGTTVHAFAAPALRDVSVTVGELDVVHRETGGLEIHVGAPSGTGTQTTLPRWADEVDAAVRAVSEHLGPMPYPDLWVSVLPDQSEGIEVTGAIQFGDLALPHDSWLVMHEVAHMWFYGLVGNNQAEDPWLDESFATFVETVAHEHEEELLASPVPRAVAGRVGEPMAFWADYRRPSVAYVAGVYTAGGAALVEARRRAGPEEFDQALRAYLSDNAHRIAVPGDVHAALADLPAAVEVLRSAGALPPGGS